MKKSKYNCTESVKERECHVNAVCNRSCPILSLREVTLFGLEVLSKCKTPAK
ncbi:MAG: hypothetical protein ACD_20C00109G0024 [uncultured bacterium]|nr:MAG: hypothetical protein ACD_20C00109G0024 [uncultured bacterium]